MEKAVHLLEEAYRDGSIMSIDGLTAALTADIISHYAYGQTSGILEDKSLKNDFRDAIMGIAHLGHLTRFFPIMASALDTLPPWLIKTLQPKLSGILDTRDRIMQQGVDAIKAEASHSGVRKKDSGKTIFETLSDKSVAPAERTPTRLRDEGLSLLVAGTETTSRSLSVGFFHILNNKDILRKLHEELKQVMATPKSTASWSQLERLPYLVCIPPPPVSPVWWERGSGIPSLMPSTLDRRHQRGAPPVPCFHGSIATDIPI
jgi:cytochrome P450